MAGCAPRSGWAKRRPKPKLEAQYRARKKEESALEDVVYATLLRNNLPLPREGKEAPERPS